MKKINVLFIALLLCVSARTAFAQVDQAFHNFETYVDVVVDSATLQTLSYNFSVDRVRRNADHTFDTRICLSFRNYDDFLAMGIPYSVVQPTRAAVTMAQNYAQMTSDWKKYPTYNTYLDMMDTFQTRYPNLCKIDTILASTLGGRKILCAHISNNLNDNQGKPSVFYTSTMHGDEVVGYYYMLRLIDMLLSNYNTDPQITNLVNNVDIWICPLHNPDGTYHTSNNQINTSSSTRYNNAGYDLNRNFPLLPGAPVVSGLDTTPQPEMLKMKAFLGAHNFTLAANFHGGAEVFNYPWDAWATTNTRAHADDAWWRYVGRKYADTCQKYHSGYFDDENNGITEGGDWYVITRSMQDYHNWFLGTRHVTIEVSTSKVVDTEVLPDYWGYSYHSLLNFMEEANYGLHGIVTDSITSEPILAKVFVNNHDKEEEHSYVETTLPYGDYHRPIKAGTYSVTYSAEGYYSKTITVNVSDGAKLTQNVQLMSTETNSCRKPKYVTVNYDGGTSAVVSWSSSAQSCNIMLNNTQISNVTSPYTLTDLASSTHYDVQVQADCGDGDLSDWTDAVGFTTDCLAQDRCDITFELTDSYGDGWNGAAIQVVDEASNEVLGTFSNTNAAGANETQTYTLSVCNGRAIKFVWVNGSYNSECSYSILDVFGDVIVSGTGAMTTTNYTVDCGLSACPKPNNVVVTETTGTTTTLSWTENGTANAWQICLNGDETNLINVTANPYTLTGLTAEASYTVKVRANCGDEQSVWSNVVSFVPSDMVTIGSGTSTSNFLPFNNYYNYSLTQQIYTTAELGEAGDILSIDFYKNNTIQCNRDLDIYMVSTTKSSFSSSSDWITVTAANKVFSGTVSFVDNDWTTITLDTPFEYDGTRNVAIIVDDNTGSYKSNTSFLTYTVSSNQAHYSYQDGSNIDPSSPSASNNSCVTSKNQIRVLISRPEPVICLAPTDLAVVELDHQIAMLNWNSEADSWKVAYKRSNDAQYAEIVATDNAYTITDLEPETEYAVMVASVCGDEIMWGEEISFTTLSAPCVAISLDENGIYRENFESYTNVTATETGVQPRCWELHPLEDVSLTAATMPQLYHGFAASGNYSLRLKNRCVYAMPELAEGLNVNELSMTFQLRQANAVYRLQVGVLEENGEFTLVKTINNATSEIEEVTVDFSDYAGTGRRIAFQNTVKKSSTLAYSTNYIDDIVLSHSSACVMELPYTENFDHFTTLTVEETGVEPDCWEVVTEDATLTSSTRPQLYRGFATSGDYSLRLKNRCVYAMPALPEGTDVRDLTMTFKLRQAKSVYRLQVGVLNAADEFEAVQTINLPESDPIQEITVDFSDYNVTGNRIAFRNTLKSGSTLAYSTNYIDDINIDYTEAAGKSVANAGNVINADAESLNIEVYPNPTKDVVNVQCSMDDVQCSGIEVVDIYGKIITTAGTRFIASDQTPIQINVSGLAAGMYFVRVTTDRGVVTKAFVKR